MVNRKQVRGHVFFDAVEEEHVNDQKKIEKEGAVDDEPVGKNLKYFRDIVGGVVDDERFQAFIIFLIVANSVVMGLQTMPFVMDNTELNGTLEELDFFFLVTFTFELCLQFFCKGYFIFLDGWIFFDFVVVVFSWISFIMDGGNFQVLRAFRIFRALRLINRVKTMRDIVNSLISTMPRMGAVSFLLSIVFYIFGVMFTTLYSEVETKYTDEESPDYLESAIYFQRLDHTLFTLFQMMTMDGWVDITREFMIINTFSYIPCIIYVCITGFIFFNLIVAILCDAIADQTEEGEMDEREKESEALQMQLNELKLAQEKSLHTVGYLMLQIHLSTNKGEKNV